MQTPKAPGPDLNSMFEVKAVPKSFRQAVPRRGAPIRPLKGLSNYDANWMKQQAYNASGLEEYNDCWTGEMAQRPIPFVSTDPKPKRAQEAFDRHIGAVFSFLVPQIVPTVQTINKISSLGYPINANPGTGQDKSGVKVHQSKFDVVLDLFEPMFHGDFSQYDDGYNTIGLRKQNEPPDKKREFQFITDEGEIVQRTISRVERTIQVPELGPMIGSRSRTIVRPPVLNLFLQCWDTMLHKAIMRHPLCDANVYAAQEFPSDSNFVTFDCKHYERYLGMAALSYARAVGGVYGAKLDMLVRYPFIVPSDDWSTFFEIRPLFREGVYPQFSSGLSPVAPLGKLTNICVQVEYFTSVKGMSEADAVNTVFTGISPGLRRWCYGDDNRLLGAQAEIDSFCKHMEQYLDIELDDKPKFLGTVFRPDLGRWVLPASTYNLKLYQPERDYEWKDYPYLGLVERRATFIRYGEPEIGSRIIPFEDELWIAVDHPFTQVISKAVAERVAASRHGVRFSPYMVTDKDYLMTEDEKIASGMFWHLKPDVTATIVNQIVGPEVRSLLTFKHATDGMLPHSERRLSSYDENPFTEDQGTEEYANEATNES